MWKKGVIFSCKPSMAAVGICYVRCSPWFGFCPQAQSSWARSFGSWRSWERLKLFQDRWNPDALGKWYEICLSPQLIVSGLTGLIFLVRKNTGQKLSFQVHGQSFSYLKKELTIPTLRKVYRRSSTPKVFPGLGAKGSHQGYMACWTDWTWWSFGEQGILKILQV